MSKKLSKETKEEITRLYDDGDGLNLYEIASQVGVSYSSAYGLTRAKERGFASLTEYEKHLAKKRGFESQTEYEKHLAKERQRRPENQELSKLIKTKLKEGGKNQSWLAKEMGITSQAVSLYVRGKNVPTEDLLGRLYSLLDVPYKTLDDLLEDIDGDK